LLKLRRHEEAATQLQRAAALAPEDREVAMFAAWAEFLVTRTAHHSARENARAAAQALLARDARAAKPHTVLGELWLDAKDPQRAAQEFELAIAANPDDDDARRGLDEAKRLLTKS
jgi:tetratricopeptide (TPR) repeat protein